MTSRGLRNCVLEFDGILGNEFCLQNAEVEFCAVQEDRLPKPCRPGMS